ncbi:MAG: SGNH/GDSL hydrolase family protein [Bacteroidales bacterium]|nr:SGNH/GDSL hydrolase family protein [Bacteroidales bacterium]
MILKNLLVTLALLLPVSLFAQDYPGVKSQWEGCDRYDFSVSGRDAIVVVPKAAAPGRPWIWRPAFFDAFASVDKALLKDGWHVAYYDVTHLYGSPRAMALAKGFYNYVVKTFGLAPKVVVEGLSRGGWCGFHWAAAYPETVACLYVDAPVCDINYWPGRGSELWGDFLQEWGLRDGDVGPDFRGNVMQLLPKLAENHIPVFACCGDADRTVEYEKNMKPVRDAYEALGGTVETVVKPGCDHHPHSLDDPEPITDFIKRYAPGTAAYRCVERRGGLDRSLAAMTVRKEATVAFLGGSITEMRGWREQVEDDLRQRFPDTQLHFIDAGISSLGSTPHAFRFEEDVLSKGMPDLLFVEAAVNDHTNGFGPREQVLGMEGIVRHALQANPEMDIVLLHFIYEPFVEMLEAGEMPDVILNHERVANHYHLPSVNLAAEVSARMRAGEFDWKQFGGTHPSWFGHKYYSAAVGCLLDECLKPRSEYARGARALPEPLDPACYESGVQLPVSAAKRLRGFRLVQDWDPADGVATRAQFVRLPVLSCEKGGSLRLEFDGTAVGLYCICGPDSGILSYSIDGKKYDTVDSYTEWSRTLYLPWVYMLADGLGRGHHVLDLQILPGKGTGCHIKSFVVNK